jgi:hypothetical protein
MNGGGANRLKCVHEGMGCKLLWEHQEQLQAVAQDAQNVWVI